MYLRVTINNLTSLRERRAKEEAMVRDADVRFRFCAIQSVAAKYIISRQVGESGGGGGGGEGEGTIQWSGNYATEFATSRPP